MFGSISPIILRTNLYAGEQLTRWSCGHNGNWAGKSEIWKVKRSNLSFGQNTLSWCVVHWVRIHFLHRESSYTLWKLACLEAWIVALSPSLSYLVSSAGSLVAPCWFLFPWTLSPTCFLLSFWVSPSSPLQAWLYIFAGGGGTDFRCADLSPSLSLVSHLFSIMHRVAITADLKQPGAHSLVGPFSYDLRVFSCYNAWRQGKITKNSKLQLCSLYMLYSLLEPCWDEQAGGAGAATLCASASSWRSGGRWGVALTKKRKSKCSGHGLDSRRGRKEWAVMSKSTQAPTCVCFCSITEVSSYSVDLCWEAYWMQLWNISGPLSVGLLFVWLLAFCSCVWLWVDKRILASSSKLRVGIISCPLCVCMFPRSHTSNYSPRDIVGFLSGLRSALGDKAWHSSEFDQH